MPLTIEIRLPSRKRMRPRATKVRQTVKALFARIVDRILNAPWPIKGPILFAAAVLGLAASLYATMWLTFIVFFVPLAFAFGADFGAVCWMIAWMMAYYATIWYAVDRIAAVWPLKPRETVIDARFTPFPAPAHI